MVGRLKWMKTVENETVENDFYFSTVFNKTVENCFYFSTVLKLSKKIRDSSGIKNFLESSYRLTLY